MFKGIKSAVQDVYAIFEIFFKGRKRYLYSEISRQLSIKNDKRSYDEIVNSLLESIAEHRDLTQFSSQFLKILNFPVDYKRLQEAIPFIEQMIKNNAESVRIKQENSTLLNMLKDAEVATDRHIAEFIADLDHNTGLLNMLEDLSRSDPNNVTIDPRELQPLLYEVFKRLAARGMKRILTAEYLKELTPEKLKDVKIIGTDINIDKDKFILADKGWEYRDHIIANAVLRKRG